MIYSFIISIDITSFSPYAVHFSLLINRIHYQIFIYPPESQVKIDISTVFISIYLIKKEREKGRASVLMFKSSKYNLDC